MVRGGEAEAAITSERARLARQAKPPTSLEARDTGVIGVVLTTLGSRPQQQRRQHGRIAAVYGDRMRWKGRG
jgi:hypothetical protein